MTDEELQATGSYSSPQTGKKLLLPVLLCDGKTLVTQDMRVIGLGHDLMQIALFLWAMSSVLGWHSESNQAKLARVYGKGIKLTQDWDCNLQQLYSVSQISNHHRPLNHKTILINFRRHTCVDTCMSQLACTHTLTNTYTQTVGLCIVFIHTAFYTRTVVIKLFAKTKL